MQMVKIENEKIPVYHCLNDSLHTFVLTLNVYAGIMYEGERENGLTHLFEHCVFRNINRIFSGNLYNELEKHGLRFNGSTFREYLRFQIDGLTGGFGFALEIFDMIFRTIELAREEFDREKDRIKAEIRESDEKHSIDWLLQDTVWHGTPLARTISGRICDINRYSQKKMNEHRGRILSQGNMFVCLTGCVPGCGVEHLVETIGRLDICAGPDFPKNEAKLPDNFGKRPDSVFCRSSKWCVAGLGIDIDNSVIPVELSGTVYNILFSGSNDVMNQRLSDDKGLIYSYDSYFEAYRNCTVIGMNYEVEKTDLIQSLDVIFDIFKDSRTFREGFKNAETKAVNRIIGILDDPETMNSDITWNVLLDKFVPGDPVEIERSLFRRISADDVVSAAEKIFRPENITLVLFGGKSDVGKLPGIVKVQ